jgi:hypothetical protein
VKESDIVKNCLTYLRLKNHMAWRNNTGRRGRISFGLRGSPDIIGIMPDGRFLGVECKVEGGTQSPEQADFQRHATERNALYIVARSLDDIIAAGL